MSEQWKAPWGCCSSLPPQTHGNQTKKSFSCQNKSNLYQDRHKFLACLAMVQIALDRPVWSWHVIGDPKQMWDKIRMLIV